MLEAPSKKSILVAFYEYFMKGRRNEAYLVIIPASKITLVFTTNDVIKVSLQHNKNNQKLIILSSMKTIKPFLEKMVKNDFL